MKSHQIKYLVAGVVLIGVIIFFAFWISPLVVSNKQQEMTQKPTVNLDQGYVIAEAYAREKFPELWNNVSDTREIRNNIKRTEASGVLSYNWQEFYITPDKNTLNYTEIQGENNVWVAIDPYTGHVGQYDEEREPSVLTGIAPVNLTPTVTKEQAEKIAEGLFPELKIRHGNKGTKLLIDSINDVVPHLVWGIGLTGDEAEPAYRDQIAFVDAHTGAIVWSTKVR